MNSSLGAALFVVSSSSLLAGPSFTVDAAHPKGTVSPRLYGLMTEEINHSYDGGLYAELISNRAFLDDAKAPANWSVVATAPAAATIALDRAKPMNNKLPVGLRVTVTQASKEHPDTRYRVSLWARAEAGFAGPLTVSIASGDGGEVYAS